MRQHANDLPAGFLLSRADRRRNRLVILFAELHHQLPDAPPPPDDPPSPEKPESDEPLLDESLLLDEPLLQLELPDEPPAGTKTMRPWRRTKWHAGAECQSP